MKITAKELAGLLNGTLEGNPEAIVSQPAKIEEGSEGSLSFLANLKYESHLYDCQSSVILIPKDLKLKQPVSATLIRVEDVYASFGLLLEKFGEQQQKAQQSSGISPQAFIHETAQIGESVTIEPLAYVGPQAQIGDNCHLHAQSYVGANAVLGKQVILHAGARIEHDCKLGNRITIHNNTVIGADGFGFAPQEDGSYKKVPQLGDVCIESDVEIGSNTCIDRATMGSTVIEQGVKLDNLVQIAHNVRVGAHTVIAAQAGVAGSTKIGKYCRIGGQVGIVGHLEIADGTQMQAQSGVGKSIKKPNTAIFGTPALPYTRFQRAHIIFKQLPELEKRLRQVEQQLRKEEK